MVKLNYAENKIKQVSVRSSRPLIARQLLVNQSPEQAISLIGNVFQICGRAQMYAATAAIEDCLQRQPEITTLQHRQQLVDMETIREHCWRIFMNWPNIVSAQADKSSLKTLLHIDSQYQQVMGLHAFAIEAQPFVPDPQKKQQCLTALQTLLEKALFGSSLNQWLEMNHTAFDNWLRQSNSLSAKVLNQIRLQHWSALGDGPTHHLQKIDKLQLESLLSTENADDFIQQPAIDGQCYESTPLSRQCTHPLIQSLLQRFGSGLLTRMTALLVEIAVLLERLSSESVTPVLTYSEGKTSASTGIGIVDAARGTLIHRVELRTGKVANYQIIAPTEWNFHPQGSLSMALGTLIATDASQLHRQASLLIEAMDPCVRYSLEVDHHA